MRILDTPHLPAVRLCAPGQRSGLANGVSPGTVLRCFCACACRYLCLCACVPVCLRVWERVQVGVIIGKAGVNIKIIEGKSHAKVAC